MVTLSDPYNLDFKDDIFQRHATRKWYKRELNS